MFIGYYNLANSITIFGLAFSLAAIFSTTQKHHGIAIVLLLLAGICDLLDGKIARRIGKRRVRERVFGIQIDSLADLISFGVAPAFIVYNLGFIEVVDLLLYMFFIISGAIRLAYFNTQALVDTKNLQMKYYTGLPIPFSCILLPPVLLIAVFINNPDVNLWIFRAFFLILGLLYIMKFRIKKPANKKLLGVFIFELIVITALLIKEIPPLLSVVA